MRKLLAAAVLRPSLEMPSDAALETLAQILESWRNRFQTASYLERRHSLQEKVTKNIAELSRAVLEIVRFDEAELEAAGDGGALDSDLRYLKARCAESVELRAEIECIQQHRTLTHSGASPAATYWQWWADVLTEDFVGAMKSTNPTFNPKLSNTGPRARYISAVVPLITGERPSVGSVATQLKGRKKGNRGKSQIPS